MKVDVKVGGSIPEGGSAQLKGVTIIQKHNQREPAAFVLFLESIQLLEKKRRGQPNSGEG